MLEFDWPWAFFALLLPLLAWWLLPRALDAGGTALRMPFYAEVVAIAGHASRSGARARVWLPTLAYLLLCVAAARPQWMGEIEMPPQSGRDLMLAVDVSGSMAAEDMAVAGRRVDRLQAVKVVIGDFLERRVGDRVGMILFGQAAYQITPLTFDRNSVRHQLDTSSVGLAGRETAIGDAIGLAVKRLRERPAQQRVLILLTDGVNTTGALQPLEAAELARVHQVRVYTVAFGADAQRGPFGISLPSAEIDEATLQKISADTGGRFFRARNTAELAGIYAELDRLEPVDEAAEPIRPRQELFHYPAAAVLLLMLLGLVWPPRRIVAGAVS